MTCRSSRSDAIGLLDHGQVFAGDVSISASSSETASSTALSTSAGIVGRPAIYEARQGRSPAISWYPPAERGWTMIGCSTPRSRIESASALGDA